MPTLEDDAGSCGAVRAQLAATEAELDKFLPANERYGRYPRSEENEAKVRPILDGVFTDEGKGRGYSVECHERICKITVDAKVARKDWEQAIQMTAWHGLRDGMMFGAETYVILRDRPIPPNEKLEIDFGEAMNTQMSALMRCREENPSPGKLVVEVKLDTSAHRLVLAMSGSLAQSKLADCLRPLWEAAIEATPVPNDATALTSSFPLDIP